MYSIAMKSSAVSRQFAHVVVQGCYGGIYLSFLQHAHQLSSEHATVRAMVNYRFRVQLVARLVGWARVSWTRDRKRSVIYFVYIN